MKLTESQQAALKHVSDYARSRKAAAQGMIGHVLEMSNVDQRLWDHALAQLKRHARVALHFHPDRLDPELKGVAQALLQQGIYKSQFETLLSSGSVSAHPGGDRDVWEKRLYGGAYHLNGAQFSERPKYGALDLMRHPDGPAPRFGSCYFILKPEVSQRCTFTYMDSHHDPDEKGTYEEFDDIVAGLLTEVFTRNFALGERSLTVRRLVTRLAQLDQPLTDPDGQPAQRNLDHYIEAQVHGEVSLREDVQKLVADPCFQGTPTGEVLQELCTKFGITLSWHSGFALSLDQVPDDFRGPDMPSLAKRVATKDYLDIHMVGEAAVSLRKNPVDWRDRGTYKEVLQDLKFLWHVLVKFGQPRSTFRPQ